MTGKPTNNRRALHGMIFDLDGTLVDSGLDFAAIRRDMGLPAGSPILETLDRIPTGLEKDRMLAVLRRHELMEPPAPRCTTESVNFWNGWTGGGFVGRC